MVSQSIHLAIFAIALIATASIVNADSCSTSDVPSSSCGNGKATAISEFQQRSLLEAVNIHRKNNANGRELNVVEWSDHLAQMAQQWANQCSTSKIPDECHSPSLIQLVYQGPYAETPYELLRENIWTNEPLFQLPRNSPELLAVGRVGCGSVLGTEGNYLVCNFAW